MALAGNGAARDCSDGNAGVVTQVRSATPEKKKRQAVEHRPAWRIESSDQVRL